MSAPARRVLPGLGLSLGLTLAYLGLVVLLPLSMIAVRAGSLGAAELWAAVTTPRVLAAFRLTFGAALAASGACAALGLLVGWVLVRYRFPGRSLVDALIDLPFALPTAVAGITLTTLLAPTGWIGRLLEPLGVRVAFTPLGIVVALTFVGLPFVVRTLQPVLEGLDADVEEAAASLGATRAQALRRVVFPALLPPLLTGFALALARAIGEYGSVVFISGNMPMKTEIAPLLIMGKLEQYDYAGATAIALAMLVVSFALLLLVNLAQWRAARRALPT